MKRVPLADFAANVHWDGIIGKPSWLSSNAQVIDLANAILSNSSESGYLYWDGSSVVVRDVDSSAQEIEPGDSPAYAVRKRISASSAWKQTWERGVFNVKHYGGAGDGGQDDTSATNSAIQALNNNGGGALFFPKGNWQCTGFLDEISENALIYGEGEGVTTIDFNGTNGFRFWSGTAQLYFSLESMSLLSFGTALLLESGTINVNRASFLSGTSAINLQSGDAHCIDSCSFTDIISDAIFVGTSCTNVRVDNVSAKNVAGKIVNDGLARAYVKGTYGNRGSNTDIQYSDRNEFYTIVPWNPPSITGSGGVAYTDFSAVGTKLGDIVSVGAPYALNADILCFGRVQANDVGRIVIMNMGTGVVDLGLGNFRFRAER